MKKQKKDEELQSRREFFKKAAKGALPILGAIVLTGAPQILRATEKAPMGCRIGCAGGCYTQCLGCLHQCNAMCQDNCNFNCKNACKGGCQGSCMGSCRGMSY